MPRKLALLTLLILSTLLLATSISPASAPSTNVPLAFEEEVEAGENGEGGFESEAECLATEAGFEAGELSEAELRQICREETAGEAPSASPCPLRSANGHAVARNGRLKVTVGYTTSKPFKARVELRRGSVQIESVQRHLGRSGVLRFSEKLGERRVERVVVRIRLPQAKTDCPAYRAVDAAVLFK